MKVAYLDAGPLLDYWVATAPAMARSQPNSAEGPRVCISKFYD